MSNPLDKILLSLDKWWVQYLYDHSECKFLSDFPVYDQFFSICIILATWQFQLPWTYPLGQTRQSSCLSILANRGAVWLVQKSMDFSSEMIGGNILGMLQQWIAMESTKAVLWLPITDLNTRDVMSQRLIWMKRKQFVLVN